VENLQNSPAKASFETRLPGKLLISAAVFGVIFSYIFGRQNIGLNMLIFTVMVYAFAWMNRESFIVRRFRDEPVMYLFSIPVVFLGVMFFTGSTVLNALSIPIMLFVMFVQYMVLSGTALHGWHQPAFLIDLFFGVMNRVFISIGSFMAGVLNAIFKNSRKNNKSAVIGALAGLALLAVIVPILLSADENLAERFNQFFKDIRFGDIILYGFLFLLGASLTAGPVANAKRENITGPKAALKNEGKRPVADVTTAVALTMVAIIYVLFAMVQFGYFFQPRETLRNVLGLTSAAYAVRGFGELMFITCLNFILLSLSMRFTAKHSEGKPQFYLKTLYVLLVAFNFVILASSHLRMQIYEESFGYTVSRFLSHSFMLLLVLLNLIMLVRVFSDRVKVIKWFAVTALVYFCTIVAINPERYVAECNIARYERAGEIDAAYLFSLSGDALVDACDFVEAHPETYDPNAQEAAIQALRRVRDHVEGGGWQSVNLAELRAYDSMISLPD
jgi:hypothetical protein